MFGVTRVLVTEGAFCYFKNAVPKILEYFESPGLARRKQDDQSYSSAEVKPDIENESPTFVVAYRTLNCLDDAIAD